MPRRLGTDPKAAADYGVSGVPACFLIGPDGKVIYTGLDAAEIRAAVTKTLRRAGNRK